MFPYAKDGVRKIYVAEILALIGTVLGLIALVGIVLTTASDEVGADVLAGGAALGTILASAVFGVLMVISYIMTIIGVSKAGKDEESFRSAMLWIVIAMTASVLQGFLEPKSEMASSLFSTISSCCNLIITYYILTGVVHLANRMGNDEVKAVASKSLKLVCAAYLIVAAVKLILTVMGGVGGTTMQGILFGSGAVITVIAAIVGIIGYILYIRALSRASAMLEG